MDAALVPTDVAPGIDVIADVPTDTAGDFDAVRTDGGPPADEGPRDAPSADKGPGSPDVPLRSWTCPPRWVAYERGGCGPAVILCAPDGGARAGACNGVDLPVSVAIDLPDGGVGRSFRRLPDGGLGGGWHEVGDPSGPPSLAEVRASTGLAACPSAWTLDVSGVCVPTLRSDCPTNSAPLPGGRCTPTALGDCPSSDYADPGTIPTGSAVLRVRAGAASGGDGSVGAPFAWLAEALSRARGGDTILVAAGTYPESLILSSDVRVAGRCAAMVRLQAPGSTGASIALTSAARVTLANLTVADDRAGVLVQSGASLTASRLVIERAIGVGLGVIGTGSAATVSDSMVTATRAVNAASIGNNVTAQAGGVVRLSTSACVAGTGISILASGAGTSVTLEDGSVLGALRTGAGQFGRGIEAGSGATLEVRRSVIAEGARQGVALFNSGTVGRLQDTFIVGTRGSILGTSHGVYVDGAARAEIERCVIADHPTLGLAVVSGGIETVRATHFVQRSTPTPGSQPRAVEVYLNGVATLDGSRSAGHSSRRSSRATTRA